MRIYMANVINFNEHKRNIADDEIITKIKLCRIRDEIEEKLRNYAKLENSELAVCLSSGRYSAMKLSKLIGREEAIQFFKDCIQTALKN